MFTAGPFKLAFHRPVLMGIINVTPDSFSDGGETPTAILAIERGKQMVAAGADWLDIGGESTRPGAKSVSVGEELKRVVPVIQGLRDAGVPLSIDTYHVEVAKEAIDAGAVILNDILGGRDLALAALAAEHDLPYIAMHMQGEPRTMQQAPHYDDVVAEVFAWLGLQVERLKAEGVRQVLVDPGIGFGKTLAHNLMLLKQLDWFLELGSPIVIGTSRKSWINKVLGGPIPISERLPGTIASSVLALEKGARVFRVHDIPENLIALKAAWGILTAERLEGDDPVKWSPVVKRAE